MNNWFGLAVGAAIFGAIGNIYAKRTTTHLNELVIVSLRTIVLVPCFAVALWFAGMPVIKPDFWMYLAWAIPVEIVLTTLLFKAFKLSSVSLVVPIFALSPLFVALFSYLIFGEALRLFQLVSLLFFVVGIYLLNFERLQVNQLLKPFRMVAADKGAQYVWRCSVDWYYNNVGQSCHCKFFTRIFFIGLLGNCRINFHDSSVA